MKKIISHLVSQKIYLCGLIALWVSLEFIILGPYSVIPTFDYADFWISAQQIIKNNFWTYGITYWLPSIGSGIDRLAQENFYHYFPNLLSLIMPIWLSNGLVIFLEYFIAFYFTYKICKTHLNMDETPSLISGIFFGLFCEFNPMLLGIYSFPFLLFCFDKIYNFENTKKSFLFAVLLGIMTCLLSLSAFLPYTLPIIPVWFIFIKRNHSPKLWGLFLVFCSVIIFLKTPSLMALLLNAKISHRDFLIPGYKQIDSGFYSEIFKRLTPWIIPSLFHVFFLVLGIYFSKFKNKTFNILFILTILTTVFANLINIIKFKFNISLAGYQFDRFFLISPLFYSILIGYTLSFFPERIFNHIKFKKWALIGVATFLFVHTSFIKINFLKEWIRHGSYYSNFQSPQIQKIASENNKNELFRVATNVSLIFPAYAQSHGLEAIDGYANIYPLAYKEFWLKLIKPLKNHNQDVYNYFSNWGNRLYLFSQESVPQKTMSLKENVNLDLLSLTNTKYIFSRNRLTDPELELVEGPKQEFYSLSKKEQIKLRLEENFSGMKSLFVYKNKSYLPRFFVVNKINAFDNTQELLQALSLANVSDLENTLFINKKYVNEDYSLTAQSKNIKLIEYSPDSIKLNVNLDGSGILVVTNSYSPYWKVAVNNIKSSIIPAHHAFWGVPLNKGTNNVSFYYDPPYKL